MPHVSLWGKQERAAVGGGEGWRDENWREEIGEG